jgi:hypothetical protein
MGTHVIIAAGARPAAINSARSELPCGADGAAGAGLFGGAAVPPSDAPLGVVVPDPAGGFAGCEPVAGGAVVVGAVVVGAVVVGAVVVGAVVVGAVVVGAVVAPPELLGVGCGVLVVAPLPWDDGCAAPPFAAGAAGGVAGSAAPCAEPTPASARLLTAAPEVSGPLSPAAFWLMSSGMVSSPPSRMGRPS